MLTSIFVKILFLVILTEAITELVIKSEIFEPLRNRIKVVGSWFEKLFSCGYCFSVWSAFTVVFIAQISYPLTGYILLDLSLTALIVHRLSNILHNIVDKWTDKYYDMRFINTERG